MTDVNEWSATGLKTIRKIKKDILKRKLMLNFIIDSYSWWDKAYRYGQLTIATLTPLSGLVNIAVESSKTMQGVTLVLSCIVAGMVKLKEYIKFSEIRDVAKSQTIKYSQLFERIERESIKPNTKKQPEDEFIYWINREFTHIELVDPELSPTEKAKFLAICKLHGIVYDEDLDLLRELMSADGTLTAALEVAELTGTQPLSPAIRDDNDDDHKDVVIEIHDGREDNLDHSPEQSRVTPVTTPEPPTTHRVLSLAVDPNHTRSRIESDARDRNSYKESLKKMNPKADLSWAMDRLSDLEDPET